MQIASPSMCIWQDSDGGAPSGVVSAESSSEEAERVFREADMLDQQLKMMLSQPIQSVDDLMKLRREVLKIGHLV